MTELRYTKSHEWIRVESGRAVIGLTTHAQEALGDIVFVELPEMGRTVIGGEACAVVESVKAVSDIFAPLSGTIVEVNAALEEDPGLVNRAAETDGWLFALKPDDPSSLSALMDRTAYEAYLASIA